MSDKDTIAKAFMQNPVIFADLFNFKIYGGRQVIKPENLTTLDPTRRSRFLSDLTANRIPSKKCATF